PLSVSYRERLPDGHPALERPLGGDDGQRHLPPDVRPSLGARFPASESLTAPAPPARPWGVGPKYRSGGGMSTALVKTAPAPRGRCLGSANSALCADLRGRVCK